MRAAARASVAVVTLATTPVPRRRIEVVGRSGLEEVYVHLASRIGQPVDDPWTAVELVLASGVALEDVAGTARGVVQQELTRLPAFRAELARGEHPVC